MQSDNSDSGGIKIILLYLSDCYTKMCSVASWIVVDLSDYRTESLWKFNITPIWNNFLFETIQTILDSPDCCIQINGILFV